MQNQITTQTLVRAVLRRRRRTKVFPFVERRVFVFFAAFFSPFVFVSMQAEKKVHQTKNKTWKTRCILVHFSSIHNLISISLTLSPFLLVLFSSSFRASSGCEPIIVSYFERKMHRNSFQSSSSSSSSLSLVFRCTWFCFLGIGFELRLCTFHVLKVCFGMVFI